jgi:hypothetical protein
MDRKKKGRKNEKEVCACKKSILRFVDFGFRQEVDPG